MFKQHMNSIVLINIILCCLIKDDFPAAMSTTSLFRTFNVSPGISHKHNKKVSINNINWAALKQMQCEPNTMEICTRNSNRPSPWQSKKHGWFLIYPLQYFRQMIYKTSSQHIHIQNEPPHDKTNNVAVRPAKTQISLGSLGIRPIWSESSLSAWRNTGFSVTHWAHWVRWAHRLFCWFCRAAAQMYITGTCTEYL